MKLHRFFAILMMIVLGASFFVACGDINGGVSENSGDNGSGTNDNGTNITITETSISIEITSYPDKVYYQVNEIFDPTGLVLSAVITEKYSDGTEKNITEEIAYPNENISFSGTDFSTEGTKIITVIYTKNEMVKYTSFEVTVGEGSLIEKTLDSISIKTLPTKTEYKVNEEFAPTGLVITAYYTNYYSDNSTMSYSNDISYDNNMSFSGTDFSTAGTKIITVTYTENETSKSATFEITVKSAAFSSIINYTKFDSELNADLSLYNGKAMTLYLDTTTVNIATLFTQFKTLYDAVGENGSVSISYADAANTTIEGENFAGLDMDLAKNPENASKFNSFFNAIATENATAESLPSITATIGVTGNLYGTGIDKFFTKYYDLGAADKLQGISVVGSAEFDAIDYLNKKGGIAYDAANQYTGNYYDINVNAALLMGAKLKNVNVTGALEQDAVFANELTNVRFNIDANGKKFDTGVNGIGLIEFAGDAPSQTPNVYSGRIIIQNAKSPITFGNGFSVDVSNLSEDAINNYVNQSTAGFVEAIYPTEATANSTKFTPSVIYAAGNLIKNTANDYSYATNQQWVKAANEDKWIEYGGLLKYPNVSALSAKAKLDEKNNTLLNTILFNNQKVYNS